MCFNRFIDWINNWIRDTTYIMFTPGRRGFVDKAQKFHDPEKYAKKFHDPEKYAKKFHDPENFSYKFILYINSHNCQF